MVTPEVFTVPKPNLQDILSFINAIISLQIYSVEVDKGSVLEKFIVPVFTLLTPQHQCQLLVDIQANPRLRGSPACLELYQTLTKGPFTYYVTRFSGILDPLPPSRHAISHLLYVDSHTLADPTPSSLGA